MAKLDVVIDQDKPFLISARILSSWASTGECPINVQDLLEEI